MNAWRDWHKILFGIVSGLMAAGLILVVSTQPRGTPIELSPLPTDSPITVYVVGAVSNPGVYQLPAGSRAEQAVQAAGGLSASADPTGINMASQLADGAQITIPEMTQTIVTQPRSAGISGTLVNLNSATLDELMTLPNIGEEKAKAIIQYRTDHGGFTTIEELQEVSGIGPATFEKLHDLITVAP